VVDRNISFGAGGIFAQEVRAALCNVPECPIIFGFIAGLGGRDVTVSTLEEIFRYTQTHDVPQNDSIWIGLREVNHAT